MKNRHLKESFSHAFNGLYQAFKTERNVKLHILIGLLTIMLGILLKISMVEWLIIIVTIGFVVVTELLNTAIEYTVDLVCGNTYNELAKYSKDIAAGATLVAAIIAVIVGGGVVFLPKLIDIVF